jgi:hypothetical protein
MKSIIVISFLLLLPTSLRGQSRDTTTPRQNLQTKQKTDRFLDADGDGICDQRAQGLGFKRGKQGEGKMKRNNQTGMSGTSSGAGKQYRGGKK